MGDEFPATAETLTVLLAMPPASRIALVREMLVGTRLVVVVDTGDSACTSSDPRVCEGWNACRSAMLGGG